MPVEVEVAARFARYGGSFAGFEIVGGGGRHHRCGVREIEFVEGGGVAFEEESAGGGVQTFVGGSGRSAKALHRTDGCRRERGQGEVAQLRIDAVVGILLGNVGIEGGKRTAIS